MTDRAPFQPLPFCDFVKSPLLRNELDTCKGSAGAGSAQLAAAAASKPQHRDICSEHNCSYLQAGIETSCPLFSRQSKMRSGNLKCVKMKACYS